MNHQHYMLNEPNMNNNHRKSSAQGSEDLPVTAPESSQPAGWGIWSNPARSPFGTEPITRLEESPFDSALQDGWSANDRTRRNSTLTDPPPGTGQAYGSVFRSSSFSGQPILEGGGYGTSPTYKSFRQGPAPPGTSSPRLLNNNQQQQPTVNILERFQQVAEATREAELLNNGFKNMNINEPSLPMPVPPPASSTFNQSGSLLNSSRSDVNSPSTSYRSDQNNKSPYVSPTPAYGALDFQQQQPQSRSSSVSSSVWRTEDPRYDMHYNPPPPPGMGLPPPPPPGVQPPPVAPVPPGFEGEYENFLANQNDYYQRAAFMQQKRSPPPGAHAPLMPASQAQAQPQHQKGGPNATRQNYPPKGPMSFQQSNRFHPRTSSSSSPPHHQAPVASPPAPNSPINTAASLRSPYNQSSSSLDTRIASPPAARREKELAANIRSPLLEEFRSNKNRKFELTDLYGHIVEFSGDQHGSRFIQQRLESAASEEKETIFNEIQSNSLQLMTDVFGNYVIQKFFELGNQMQKTILAKQMEGHILNLSLQMYGCRVVQKAIEHILTDQQAVLIKELDGHVLKCVKDQNGNHVIQKAIERIPGKHIGFILESFNNQVYQLATHPYGCRVIQRMLEYSDQESQRKLLDELHGFTQYLVEDQYGNYVIQHVVQRGKPQDKSKIIGIVRDSVLTFSRHKYASNVVEKCIMCGSLQQRSEIIDEILRPRQEGTVPITVMMRDQFANYVIQKLLEVTSGDDHDRLVAAIRPQLQSLKKYSYGKHLISIEKLLNGAATGGQ